MNIHASLADDDKTAPPRFLMCPPRHFAVTYSINPWMNPSAWADGGTALHTSAQRQWRGLRGALATAGAAIETLSPVPGLPDLVFTANGAVVLDGRAVLARFRYRERQDEQPLFATTLQTFQARGLIEEVVELPSRVRLEGAGDCIWDGRRQLFWLGCGFRSDAAAALVLEQNFGVRCVALSLADPRFYHLDTAFCALPCGSVIYYPAAFTAAARAAMHERIEPQDRIVLDRTDAVRFAANAVCVGRTIVLSSASEGLKVRLAERGYAVIETALDVFQRSGGSACCLTLRLNHRSARLAREAKPIAAHGGESTPVRRSRALSSSRRSA